MAISVTNGPDAAVSLPENTNFVTTVQASGGDPSATLVYGIASGIDSVLFQIDAATGVLSFLTAPDFDIPADADGDSVYDVTVVVTDGTSTASQTLTVTVYDTFDTLSVLGSPGFSRLKGTSGADWLDGLDGGDWMAGGVGDDIYSVDSRTDRVVEAPGGGNDAVLTALSRYSLGQNVEALVFTDDAEHKGTGNELANRIFGGNGNDVLDGRGGADILMGRGGDDLYRVDTGGDTIVERAGGGTDSVIASVSYTLSAHVENLTLRNVATALDGTGSEDDNVLRGNTFANALAGGDGDDVLAGGKGNDSLTGGSGADRFLFDSKPDAFVNRDTVTDFAHGEDLLVFSRPAFRGLAAPGALDAEAFVAGAGLDTAADASDRFIYNTATGVLWYDPDGIGRAKAVQVAVLSGLPELDHSDILIIA